MKLNLSSSLSPEDPDDLRSFLLARKEKPAMATESRPTGPKRVPKIRRRAPLFVLLSAVILARAASPAPPPPAQPAAPKASSRLPMAISPQTFNVGDVFAGIGNGQVARFTAGGNLLQTLNSNSGSTETTGMCFDVSNNLYSTQFSISAMAKFDNQGNVTYPWGGANFAGLPESCVLDSSGNVYVGQASGAASTAVLEFDQNGNLLASFSPAVENRGTDWIDLAADQCTLYYTSEGASVKRFDVCSNTQLSDLTATLAGPCFALRIRPNANAETLVACRSQVYRLDSTGNVLQQYQEPPGNPSPELFALNLDPDGTTFWTSDDGGADVNDNSGGTVYHFDIATGALLGQFNTGTPSTGGLAVLGEITAACTPTAPALTIDNGLSETLGVGGIYTLQWTDSLNGQPGQYQILVSEDGGPFLHLGAPTTATSYSHQLISGDAGHNFQFEVVAQFACGGAGATSNVVSLTVCGAPASPSPLTVNGASSATIAAGQQYTLGWQDTLAAIGEAGQYEVEISTNNGATYLHIAYVSGTTYTHTTISSDGGHTFLFEVIAEPSCSAELRSAPSNSVTLIVTGACTTAGQPGTVAILPPAGEPSGAGPQATDYLTLSWQNDASSPADEFAWKLSTETNFNTPQGNLCSGSNCSASHDPVGSLSQPLVLYVEGFRACDSFATPGPVGQSPPITFGPPVANFTSSSAHAGQTVQFTDTSSNATGWLWIFGDNNSSSNAQNATHTFSQAGGYNVGLIAFNGSGASAPTIQQITVATAAAGAQAAGLRVVEAFDASRQDRQELDNVSIGRGEQAYVSLTNEDSREAIVFFYLQDAVGRTEVKHAFFLEAGEQTAFDPSAYAGPGTYTLLLYSAEKYSAFLTTHRDAHGPNGPKPVKDE